MADEQEGGPRLKKCSKCGCAKQASDFYARKASADGLHPYCKACVLAGQKKYREQNADAVKARKRDYYSRTAEDRKRRSRDYYLAHKDEIRAKTREKYASDPEFRARADAQSKKYRETNPLRILERDRARARRRREEREEKKVLELSPESLYTVVIPDGWKYCKCCKSVKGTTQFHRDRSKQDLLSTNCKICRLESSAAWNKANWPRVREASKLWQRRNRQRIERMSVNWPSRQRDAVRARGRLYARRAYEANPEKFRARRAAYDRACRKLPGVSWAAVDAYYKLAKDLERASGVRVHVDHCFPVHPKHGVCGLHVPANFQVITVDENVRKSNKLPGIFREMLWDPDADNVHYPAESALVPHQLGEWEKQQGDRLQAANDGHQEERAGSSGALRQRAASAG